MKKKAVALILASMMLITAVPVNTFAEDAVNIRIADEEETNLGLIETEDSEDEVMWDEGAGEGADEKTATEDSSGSKDVENGSDDAEGTDRASGDAEGIGTDSGDTGENDSGDSKTEPDSGEDTGENTGVYYDNEGNVGGTWTLEDGVLTIEGTGEFDGAGVVTDSVEKLIIGPGITRIGRIAWAENLKEVELPSTLKTIDAHTFVGCKALETITIPAGVEKIGENTFDDCSNLKTVILPENLQSIDGYAFMKCTSLERIHIPGSVKTIGERAFIYCNQLKYVELEDGIQQIGDCAFLSCTALQSLELPDSIKKIGILAFWNCSGLESIKLPGNLQTIELDTFFECKSLKKIEIPESVTEIGVVAFGNCDKLESVTFAGSHPSLKKIESGAFENCKSLRIISFPDTVEVIGNGSFMDCVNLTKAEIPGSVIEIEDWAFAGCSKLETVTFAGSPSSLKRIGKNAFYNCESLKNIILPNTVETIGASAWEGCVSLNTIEIPNSVQSLGEEAFKNCTTLKEVSLSNNIPVINKYTFSNVWGLDELTIPASVTHISVGAFEECQYLQKIVFLGTKEEWLKISIEDSDDYNNPLNNAWIYCSDGDLCPRVIRNQWSFKNYVETPMPISKKDKEILIENGELKNNNLEKRKIEKWISKGSDGYCGGMALTSLLVALGKLTPEQISNSTQLYYADRDAKSKSALSFYQLHQHTKVYKEEERKFRKLNIHRQLDKLTTLRTPYLLSFHVRMENYPGTCRDKEGSHAVVVKNIEYGNWRYHGNEYTVRARLYDSNHLDRNNEENDLYFNPNTGKWEIPSYLDERPGFKFMFLKCATNNIDVLENCSILGDPNTAYASIQQGILDKVGVRLCGGEFNVFKILDIMNDKHENAYGYVTAASLSEGEEVPPFEIEIADAESVRFEAEENLKEIDASVMLGNNYVDIQAPEYETVTVSKNDAALTGIKGDFSLEYTVNNNPIEASTIQITGTDMKELKVWMDTEGFLIEGDNLEGIKVTAGKMEEDSFDIEEIGTFAVAAEDTAVMLRADEEQNIGLYRDTDGDGEFETVIEQKTTDEPSDDPNTPKTPDTPKT
ncbi:MAG: leucine-rich repeat protein, partial [Eubacteriales bacterium]|nr:leucine-rich repeat protein [Eubacteriales bacterium]